MKNWETAVTMRDNAETARLCAERGKKIDALLAAGEQLEQQLFVCARERDALKARVKQLEAAISEAIASLDNSLQDLKNPLPS